MFTHAYLQEAGNGRLGHEEQLLRSEFERRGIPVTLYTRKRIERRQLPLSASTFIAGDMDMMHGAMRQLKIEPPPPNDYPKSLEPYLHRRVWASTLGTMEQRYLQDHSEALFIKPADRCKSFTGRMFSDLDDFRVIGSTSRRQDVWCSEPVEWLSEYRVYVIGPRVVSVDRYRGDPDVMLDLAIVEVALKTLRAAGEAHAAFGIDFGVLSTGETALVEMNEGYSLGAYQIPAPMYTDLLMARWQELVALMPGGDAP